MSVIAGMVHLDGATARRSTVERMAARVGSRAPDGCSIVCTGSASFLYGRLDVTPGAERETQPLADPRTALIIVFDGRVDNRSGVIDALELDAAAQTSDAALVLQAHLVWGEGATERLTGDFAYVIWDGSRRRLVCARDTSGLRPLFYRAGDGWIAWASAIDLLAACIDPMPPVNEGMAGEYLTGLVTDKRETLFSGIYRVPPAHQLIANGGSTRTRRYWTPDPRHEIRYARDEDYAAHLTDLLRDVVAARLRTSHPVGVMLSGGVDSSSVAGLATELCRAGGAPAPAIEAFSISYPGHDDERPFFEMVTRMWDLPAHCVSAAPPRPGQFRDEIAADLEVQIFPHAPTADPLRALVRDRGARVLLTGMGADDWFGSTPLTYADLFARGRWGALARRARAERTGDDFIGWPSVARSALWPLVPRLLQRVVRAALRRGRPPAWLEPEFAARIALADRAGRHRDSVVFRSHEQADIWHEGTSGMLVYSLETTARSIARFGVDYVHPFHDRRIVEFGLALPSDQRWRDGYAKPLLRRAMTAHLPAAVAARRTSPGGDQVFVEAIAAEGGARAFDDLATTRLGWTRGDEIRAMHTRMLALYQNRSRGYGSMAWTLWSILAMNLWLDAANVIEYPVTASPEGAQRV